MPVQQLIFELVAVLHPDMTAVVYAIKAGNPVLQARHS